MEWSLITEKGLSVVRGGSGDRLFVLLHGMGAMCRVGPGIPLIERSRRGRWIAPDLRGHGRSLKEPPYSFGMHAADIADFIASEAARRCDAGRSFVGGVVAALVASNLFCPQVRGVAAIGVKIEWTPDEIAKTQEVAQRPARTFATRDERSTAI